MISLLMNTSANFMAGLQGREQVGLSPYCGLITISGIKHLLRIKNKSLCDGVMAHSKCFLLIR
jgi:hypothetical protein